MTFEGRTQTYAELHQRVGSLASGLADLGVTRGDRVAVCMYNRAEVLESYFAVVSLGAIVVPVNFRLADAEVEFILKDCDPRVVIADGEMVASVLASDLGKTGTGVIVCTAPVEGHDQVVAYGVLCNGELPSVVDVDEGDPAFIMYTSGTTGRPKGAVLTHMNLLMNSVNCSMLQGASEPDEVWLSGLPLFHIGGLNGILNYLLVGGHSVLMPSGNFNAADVVATIESFAVTGCYFVPTQWKEICGLPDVTARTQSLRRISWGASSAPPSTLKAMEAAFPGVPNFNMFGQTEMSSVTCALRGKDAVRKMGTVGTPVPNVEVQIVRPDGDECAVGEVGEIVYRGPTVMREYWRNPQATAEAFRGGWFHSGDLCVRDEDGFISVVDRAKDMIISGGENIYSAEVENALDAHPNVAEVAVVSRPDPKWVETPVAFVVPTDPQAPPSQAELIDFCKDRIASYKKPSAVVIVDELPRNATGKVQKFLLRERAKER